MKQPHQESRSWGKWRNNSFSSFLHVSFMVEKKKGSRIFLRRSGPFHNKMQHLKQRGEKGKSPPEKNSSASMFLILKLYRASGTSTDLRPLQPDQRGLHPKASTMVWSKHGTPESLQNQKPTMDQPQEDATVRATR